MTQTLLLVVLFVAGMATLPWLVRRIQQRHAKGPGAGAAAPRVVSAIAVGPHQRVVTVEVGEENERTILVLGVTPQSICCLHTQPTRRDVSGTPAPSAFTLEMAHAVADSPRTDKQA
jgi:flagellar protein FliO/FliZ